MLNSIYSLDSCQVIILFVYNNQLYKNIENSEDLKKILPNFDLKILNFKKSIQKRKFVNSI